MAVYTSIALCSALMACSPEATATQKGAAPESKRTVLTTIYPLQYLAQRIGGDRVKATNLVPPGVETHDWEPSPRDISSIQKADLFIYNGGGFEPWADRAIDGLSKDGPIVVEASAGLEMSNGDGQEDGLDPHLWLDPHRYQQQAEAIAEALRKADPPSAEVYSANLNTLREDLDHLRKEMEQGLASCERGAIVVSHAAFGHLVGRLGLKQIAVSGLSPEVEPSPARMREIIEDVQRLGATHIFFETLVNSDVSKTIAREVGAETLVLNPLEGLTREEQKAGEDYFSIMGRNLANLRTALGCR